MFDYRYKDHETGKLNVDKLGTLNSETLASIIEGDGGGCYEFAVWRSGHDEYRGIEEQYHAIVFPERAKELKRVKREQEKAEKLERARVQAQHELHVQERKMNVLRDTRRQLDEIEEYRRRLQEREEELARIRRKSEEERLIFLGGPDSGRYIITSNGKVRQGS